MRLRGDFLGERVFTSCSTVSFCSMRLSLMNVVRTLSRSDSEGWGFSDLIGVGGLVQSPPKE